MTADPRCAAPRLRIVLLYVAVCLVWGTTWYGMKLSVETLPPMTAAGLRFALAFPFLLTATLVNRRSALLPPRGLRWVVPFMAVNYICVPYALINYGERYISSGLAALLFSSVVVFLLLFSVLISRLSVRPMQWFGVLTGLACLAGIVQLTAGISTRSFVAPAAVLLAAVLHALTYAVLGRYGGSIHVLTQETLPIGLGAAGLLIVGVVVERPDFGAVSARSIGGLLYLGIVASVLGFAAYFYLIQNVNAVVVSYVFVLFPVVAMLGSAMLEHAALPPLAIGLAVVMLAAFGLTKRGQPAEAAGAPAETETGARPHPAASRGSAAAVGPASGRSSRRLHGTGLSDPVLQIVFGHAVAAYPGEACGFVHASGNVRAARNVATEMHRADPLRYPRTDGTGYVLSAEDMTYLESHVDAADPVVVLYHSHPNGRAYFSEEDRRHALFEGRPLYPTLGQLVVGVDETGVREARLFRFEKGEYVEREWFAWPQHGALEAL